MKKVIYSLILLVLIGTLFSNRVKLKNVYIKKTLEPVPMAININEVKLEMVKSDDVLPAEYNLDVPFMVQAPNESWDLPYQEACEEAVIIMAHYYLNGEELDIESADREILDLVNWQEEYLGYYKDTTVAETVYIIRKYWGHKVEVINNPTVDIIKRQIASGSIVVAPFYGKALGNPYYSGDGPLYHMMVLKGYTDSKFITNDPGTKRGENYMYDYDVIMSAMHDWNDGDVENGKAVIFIVK